MKLCKDCKHVRLQEPNKYGFAMCAILETTDAVSGNVNNNYCAPERMSILGECGIVGKLWEWNKDE